MSTYWCRFFAGFRGSAGAFGGSFALPSEPRERRRLTGITQDTGVLIALERRGQHVPQLFQRAVERELILTVPADVVAEWWRGRTDLRDARERRCLAIVWG